MFCLLICIVMVMYEFFGTVSNLCKLLSIIIIIAMFYSPQTKLKFTLSILLLYCIEMVLVFFGTCTNESSQKQRIMYK